MHKTDLIKEIANVAAVSQKDAGNSLDAALKTITEALKKGETITLIGFGTFKVSKSAARKGRNPQTGEEINIKASNRVKFTAGKALKDAVN